MLSKRFATVCIVVLICTSGCISNMPIHYQQNNSLPTTPAQIENTQAIIDARLHAQQDFNDGFTLEHLPLFRLQALEGKPNSYKLFYEKEYRQEINRLKTTKVNNMVSSYAIVIGLIILIVYLANNQL